MAARSKRYLKVESTNKVSIIISRNQESQFYLLPTGVHSFGQVGFNRLNIDDLNIVGCIKHRGRDGDRVKKLK